MKEKIPASAVKMIPQPLKLEEVIPMPLPVSEFSKKLKAMAIVGWTHLYDNGPLKGYIAPSNDAATPYFGGEQWYWIPNKEA